MILENHALLLKESNSLSKDAATAQKTLGNAYQRFIETIKETGGDIFRDIKPQLIGIFNFLSNSVEFLSKSAKGFVQSPITQSFNRGGSEVNRFLKQNALTNNIPKGFDFFKQLLPAPKQQQKKVPALFNINDPQPKPTRIRQGFFEQKTIGLSQGKKSQFGFLGKTIADTEKGIRLLPKILADAGKKGIDDLFSVTIANKLQNAGIGKSVADALTSTLEEMDTRGIIEKFDRLADDTTKEGRKFLTAVSKIADKLNEQANQIGASLSNLISVERNILEGKTRIASLRLQRKGIPGIKGQPNDFEKQQPFFRGQELLTGLKGFNATNPTKIGARAKAVQERLFQARRQREDSQPGSKKFLEADFQVRLLSDSLGRLKIALTNLVDSTDQNAIAFDRLEEIQNRRSQRSSFIQDLISADPKQRREILQDARAFGSIVNPTKDTKRIGNEALRTFGGGLAPKARSKFRKLSRPEQEDLIRNRPPNIKQVQGALRFAQGQGPEAIDKLLKAIGIKLPEDKEIEKQRKIQTEINKTQIDAQKQLNDVFTKEQKEISSRLIGGFDKFAETVDKFSKSVEGIPSELTITGTEKVEIILNGAEVLTKILPSISELIDQKIREKLSKVISRGQEGSNLLDARGTGTGKTGGLR